MAPVTGRWQALLVGSVARLRSICVGLHPSFVLCFAFSLCLFVSCGVSQLFVLCCYAFCALGIEALALGAVRSGLGGGLAAAPPLQERAASVVSYCRAPPHVPSKAPQDLSSPFLSSFMALSLFAAGAVEASGSEE